MSSLKDYQSYTKKYWKKKKLFDLFRFRHTKFWGLGKYSEASGNFSGISFFWNFVIFWENKFACVHIVSNVGDLCYITGHIAFHLRLNFQNLRNVANIINKHFFGIYMVRQNNLLIFWLSVKIDRQFEGISWRLTLKLLRRVIPNPITRIRTISAKDGTSVIQLTNLL